MSRLESPIKRDILYATGDILLRAELVLLLKDNSGNWQPETFRVDTGSDICSMPAWYAKSLNLPIPQQAVTATLTTPMGQVQVAVRSGYLRFKVDGMDQTEYAVPCQFLGDLAPIAPPT